MLKELLARRVLVVLGKGGVGKTTASAAIAKLCAASGSRALLMETDTRAPLAAMFAVEPSFVPKRRCARQRPGDEPPQDADRRAHHIR